MKMRVLPILLAVAFAAVVAAAAFAWAGRPSSPAPKPAQAGGPPPAWIENTTRSSWLDYGTYCWRTGCADYIPPAQRPGLRSFRTRIGDTLRIHLTFVPRTVSAGIVPAKNLPRLKSARTISWHVKKLGILQLEMKAAAGSASYVIKLQR